MALHYLDPTREPRECDGCPDCNPGMEPEYREMWVGPRCHGTGRLGEEGAEPDVETRYYDDGFTETGWYAGEPNGELWTGPHSTEADALTAARKAHREES